ncbi:hypothetical protein GmHk_11G032370 [Glycine max]|nr:hypothetical protein GmHk_11G032370 [Glycine max]
MERMMNTTNLAKKNVVVGQCPDMEGLITQCAEYVKKFGLEMSPSSGCCYEIKNADTPCLCQHFTKALLEFIDIQKDIYILRMYNVRGLTQPQKLAQGVLPCHDRSNGGNTLINFMRALNNLIIRSFDYIAI